MNGGEKGVMWVKYYEIYYLDIVCKISSSKRT